MDYVITIMHGTTFRFRTLELLRCIFYPRTWKRWLRPCRSALELRERTPWLRWHSGLRMKLFEIGSEGQVRTYPFFWSGRNGIGDRNQATIRLQKKVVARMRRYPNASHIIIAHSHAGNVALYAIRDSTVISSKLHGLICLSTPFLHARPRNQSDATSALTLGVVMLLIILAIVFWKSTPASSTMTKTFTGDSPAFWASLAGSLGVILALVAAYFLSKRYSEKLLRQMSFPKETPPVLTIRAPGDEASLALSAPEFLLWMSNTVWSGTWHILWQGFTETFNALNHSNSNSLSAKDLIFGLSLWVLFGSWFSLWWLGGPSISGTLTFALWIPSLVAGAALFLAFVCVVGVYFWGLFLFILWPILALCLLPFGANLAIAAAFLDMNVGWSPPGRSEAVLLPDVREGTGLAHSASYQDPRALDIIADWIQAVH